jgi:hypothetical protein
MNFLNIRVIINGKAIYTLPVNKPVLIPISENHPQVVATDGFHITKPVTLEYEKVRNYHLRLVCAIDDNLLLTGALLLVIFFLVGVISDIALFRFLSLMPVFYFLFYYYVNRKDFIRIKAG